MIASALIGAFPPSGSEDPWQMLFSKNQKYNDHFTPTPASQTGRQTDRRITALCRASCGKNYREWIRKFININEGLRPRPTQHCAHPTRQMPSSMSPCCSPSNYCDSTAISWLRCHTL